ncbi:MAG: hypothetical protein ACRBCT_04650, partial [Alphaproteobacteria bacterium]
MPDNVTTTDKVLAPAEMLLQLVQDARSGFNAPTTQSAQAFDILLTLSGEAPDTLLEILKSDDAANKFATDEQMLAALEAAFQGPPAETEVPVRPPSVEITSDLLKEFLQFKLPEGQPELQARLDKALAALTSRDFDRPNEAQDAIMDIVSELEDLDLEQEAYALELFADSLPYFSTIDFHIDKGDWEGVSRVVSDIKANFNHLKIAEDGTFLTFEGDFDALDADKQVEIMHDAAFAQIATVLETGIEAKAERQTFDEEYDGADLEQMRVWTHARDQKLSNYDPSIFAGELTDDMLAKHESFLTAAKILYDMKAGKEGAWDAHIASKQARYENAHDRVKARHGLKPVTPESANEELTKWALQYTSDLSMQAAEGLSTVWNIDDWSKEQQTAMLYALRAYEHKNMSWAGVGRAASSMATDEATWAMAGGGFLAGWVTGGTGWLAGAGGVLTRVGAQATSKLGATALVRGLTNSVMGKVLTHGVTRGVMSAGTMGATEGLTTDYLINYNFEKTASEAINVDLQYTSGRGIMAAGGGFAFGGVFGGLGALARGKYDANNLPPLDGETGAAPLPLGPTIKAAARMETELKGSVSAAAFAPAPVPTTAKLELPNALTAPKVAEVDIDPATIVDPEITPTERVAPEGPEAPVVKAEPEVRAGEYTQAVGFQAPSATADLTKMQASTMRTASDGADADLMTGAGRADVNSPAPEAIDGHILDIKEIIKSGRTGIGRSGLDSDQWLALTDLVEALNAQSASLSRPQKKQVRDLIGDIEQLKSGTKTDVNDPDMLDAFVALRDATNELNEALSKPANPKKPKAAPRREKTEPEAEGEGETEAEIENYARDRAEAEEIEDFARARREATAENAAFDAARINPAMRGYPEFDTSSYLTFRDDIVAYREEQLRLVNQPPEGGWREFTTLDRFKIRPRQIENARSPNDFLHHMKAAWGKMHDELKAAEGLSDEAFKIVRARATQDFVNTLDQLRTSLSVIKPRENADSIRYVADFALAPDEMQKLAIFKDLERMRDLAENKMSDSNLGSYDDFRTFIQNSVNRLKEPTGTGASASSALQIEDKLHDAKFNVSENAWNNGQLRRDILQGTYAFTGYEMRASNMINSGNKENIINEDFMKGISTADPASSDRYKNTMIGRFQKYVDNGLEAAMFEAHEEFMMKMGTEPPVSWISHTDLYAGQLDELLYDFYMTNPTSIDAINMIVRYQHEGKAYMPNPSGALDNPILENLKFNIHEDGLNMGRRSVRARAAEKIRWFIAYSQFRMTGNADNWKPYLNKLYTLPARAPLALIKHITGPEIDWAATRAARKSDSKAAAVLKDHKYFSEGDSKSKIWGWKPAYIARRIGVSLGRLPMLHSPAILARHLPIELLGHNAAIALTSKGGTFALTYGAPAIIGTGLAMETFGNETWQEIGADLKGAGQTLYTPQYLISQHLNPIDWGVGVPARIAQGGAWLTGFDGFSNFAGIVASDVAGLSKVPGQIVYGSYGKPSRAERRAEAAKKAAAAVLKDRRVASLRGFAVQFLDGVDADKAQTMDAAALTDALDKKSPELAKLALAMAGEKDGDDFKYEESELSSAALNDERVKRVEAAAEELNNNNNN